MINSSYACWLARVHLDEVCDSPQQLRLTVQLSWWISWGAGLSCWAVRRGRPQWPPTAEPGWTCAGTDPDWPWFSWSSAGQTCGRAAHAAERREETLGGSRFRVNLVDRSWHLASIKLYSCSVFVLNNHAATNLCFSKCQIRLCNTVHACTRS